MIGVDRVHGELRPPKLDAPWDHEPPRGRSADWQSAVSQVGNLRAPAKRTHRFDWRSADCQSATQQTKLSALREAVHGERAGVRCFTPPFISGIHGELRPPRMDAHRNPEREWSAGLRYGALILILRRAVPEAGAPVHGESFGEGGQPTDSPVHRHRRDAIACGADAFPANAGFFRTATRGKPRRPFAGGALMTEFFPARPGYTPSPLSPSRPP